MTYPRLSYISNGGRWLTASEEPEAIARARTVGRRTTSDGLTLTWRQADDIAEFWPGVTISKCTHEFVRDLLVVYDRDGDGECVLMEKVRT